MDVTRENSSTADVQLVKDFTATSLIGPNATPAQVTNGALVGFLYHCQYNLLFIETEFPAKVWEIMQKTIIVSLHDCGLPFLPAPGRYRASANHA